MRYVLLGLLLLLAGCASQSLDQLCRNAPQEGFVMLDCVEYGFSEDRQSVQVRVDGVVEVASFMTEDGTGKCTVQQLQDQSVISCPVAAEGDGRTFVEIAGAVEHEDDYAEFLLEVQLA